MLTNKVKTQILTSIFEYGTTDSYTLTSQLGKKYNVKFENSVMRYVRRLKAAGYLKRTARGFYKITTKGMKFVSKNI